MKSKPTNITSEGTSKKLVPELRFPEFVNEGEWKEYKLKDIAEFFKGKGISKQEVVSGGKVPCIRYGELYTTYNEVINHVKSSTNTSKSELFLSKANDIIIPSSGETKEDISTASCVLKDDIALGGDINVLRTKQDGIFMSYYLNNAKKDDIAKIAQGISIIHLYNEQLRTLKVSIPALAEQQKIAQCLSSIDELIAATKDKVEQLKEHKSGLMQKLFPAKGKTHPMLRFPMLNNDEEWEEIELKDACHMQAGKFISAAEISERGLYPCYGGNGMRGKTNEYNYSGKHPIIGRQGALCGNVCLVDGTFYATEHAVVVTPKNEYDSTFLYYILCYLNLNQYATGQAQPGLAVDSILKIKCTILHDLDEQNKITSILSSLDDMIIQYTEKVKTLELHKKGLMQKLFPKK